MNNWNESDHPRDGDGKFTDKAGGGSGNDHETTKQKLSAALNKLHHAAIYKKLTDALDKDKAQKQETETVKKAEELAKKPREKKVDVIKRLASYKDKPQATYNYDTGEVVHLTSGYMVSFHCNEADKDGHYKSHFGRYTEEEYDNLANSFAEENDADTYIGTYDEEPEVSFHIKNLDQARKLMIKYNQDAIWDNAAGVPIMNKKRDKSKNPMRGE